MAELKTKANDESVDNFLNRIENQKKREDSILVCKIMQEITGEKPKMWGTSIVGFGTYHYKYKSGREGDWFICGFSPRKQSLTLYIMGGLKKLKDLTEKLGKFKTGKGCFYINKIEDVNIDVLKKIIHDSMMQLKSFGIY